MRIKQLILVTLLAVIIPNRVVYGQIDSLKHAIENPSSDTSMWMNMNRLAFQLRKQNLDTAILISQKVLNETGRLIPNKDKSIENEVLVIRLFALSNLSVLYRRNNEVKKAIDNHKSAEYIINRIPDNLYKANYYANYAEVLYEIGDIKGTIEYYSLSRDIYQKLNNKKGIAGSYYNIAKIYFTQNKYRLAIENTNKAINYLDKTEENLLLTSFCFNLIANCYSRLSNETNQQHNKDSLNRKSLNYYELSYKIKLQFNDVAGQIVTLNNIANTYYFIGDYERALEKVEESLKLSVSIGDERLLTNCYVLYAMIYLEKGDVNQAFFYGDLAYKNAKKIDNLDFQQHASLYLSKIYKLKNDPLNALKYYEISTTIKDSLVNKEHLTAILNYEKSFDIKRKSIEDSIRFAHQTKVYTLEMLKKEAVLNQRQTQKNWFITIIISLVLLLFFIVYNYRIQVRSKIRLAEKNSQIQEQNNTLAEQKLELEAINKSLKIAYQDKIDSIKYAKKIQSMTFPTEASIKKSLPQSFIIYKPLDIVSGDLYWVRKIEDEVIIAIGDSTGHGVPGAFLSIMGIAILKEAVNTQKILNAANILNIIRQRIIESLRQYSTDNAEEHYGMDLGIVIFNTVSKTIQYAGAYTPMCIIKNASNIGIGDEQVIQAKPDKMPISMFPKLDPYTNQEFQLQPGDTFYMYTDGFIDQNKAKNGKKLGTKGFVETLVEISSVPINSQAKELERLIKQWSSLGSNNEENTLQTDDITIIGVRV
ncbi:MAG: SpoIIE family protein phosphatase [Bacteroidales bacterium]|nr:SpoIIE family protein phosphatase [Bacteroidales bacterium]